MRVLLVEEESAPRAASPDAPVCRAATCGSRPGKTRACSEPSPFWGHGAHRNEMSALQPLLRAVLQGFVCRGVWGRGWAASLAGGPGGWDLAT